MPQIQLIDPSNHEINLMAIVLDEHKKPLLDKKSLCFYGKIKVNEPSRRIGENSPRELARLTEYSLEFDNIGSADDQHITEAINWDSRYHMAFAISCYQDSPDADKRVFKDWQSQVRITHNQQEIASFTLKDLGDLSTTGCIQIGLTEPVINSFLGWFSNKQTLPICGNVVKYNNAEQWLAEYGIK